MKRKEPMDSLNEKETHSGSSSNVQEKLIEYYEKINPTFKIAKKLIDDTKGRSNILDRLGGDELKMAYIRGLIILYKYGRVSTKRFNINTNFIRNVLKLHPNCSDKIFEDKYINRSKYNPENEHLWDLVILAMRIDVGLNECEVDLDKCKSYPKEETQNNLNEQDNVDNYWEDGNKRTMDEQNKTGQSHVSNIQQSDKGKNKMDDNEN
uniref:Uncharacterized protein n=1 Tax=Meloidogyne floridensis TaxID=298350 RepID=A0A915P8F5_9BILA